MEVKLWKGEDFRRDGGGGGWMDDYYGLLVKGKKGWRGNRMRNKVERSQWRGGEGRVAACLPSLTKAIC